MLFGVSLFAGRPREPVGARTVDRGGRPYPGYAVHRAAARPDGPIPDDARGAAVRGRRAASPRSSASWPSRGAAKDSIAITAVLSSQFAVHRAAGLDGGGQGTGPAAPVRGRRAHRAWRGRRDADPALAVSRPGEGPIGSLRSDAPGTGSLGCLGDGSRVAAEDVRQRWVEVRLHLRVEVIDPIAGPVIGELATRAARHAGAAYASVATLDEALRLREARDTWRTIVNYPVPADGLAEAAVAGIEVVAGWEPDITALAWSGAAAPGVHLEVGHRA